MDPSGEVRAGLVPIPIVIDANKGVVHGVHGLITIDEDAQAVKEDLSAISFIEYPKRMFVPPFHQHHELVIGGFPGRIRPSYEHVGKGHEGSELPAESISLEEESLSTFRKRGTMSIT